MKKSNQNVLKKYIKPGTRVLVEIEKRLYVAMVHVISYDISIYTHISINLTNTSYLQRE